EVVEARARALPVLRPHHEQDRLLEVVRAGVRGGHEGEEDRHCGDDGAPHRRPPFLIGLALWGATLARRVACTRTREGRPTAAPMRVVRTARRTVTSRPTPVIRTLVFDGANESRRPSDRVATAL